MELEPQLTGSIRAPWEENHKPIKDLLKYIEFNVVVFFFFKLLLSFILLFIFLFCSVTYWSDSDQPMVRSQQTRREKSQLALQPALLTLAYVRGAVAASFFVFFHFYSLFPASK